ncbi:unnamed protein product [Brassica rapa subsp. narinosa]
MAIWYVSTSVLDLILSFLELNYHYLVSMDLDFGPSDLHGGRGITDDWSTPWY